jgi:plasmid maintenance system antidote protein VapI
MSRPLQISAETAIKLSEQLKVPIEHLMHMPKHILLQKLAELAASEQKSGEETPKDKES